MHDYLRPLPAPDGVSSAFWQAARAHVLRLQYCEACGRFVHPPKPRCPACLRARLSWRPVEGGGTVYTFAVVEHVTPDLHFEASAPYASGLVELDVQSGLLFHTRFVGGPVNAVHVGMQVEPCFEDVTPDITLVHFAPKAIR